MKARGEAKIRLRDCEMYIGIQTYSKHGVIVCSPIPLANIRTTIWIQNRAQNMTGLMRSDAELFSIMFVIMIIMFTLHMTIVNHYQVIPIEISL